MSGIVSLLEGERKRKRWVGVDGAHFPLSAYITVAIGTANRFPNLAPVYSHTCRQLDVRAHTFTEKTDRCSEGHAGSNTYTVAHSVQSTFLHCHGSIVSSFCLCSYIIITHQFLKLEWKMFILFI